MLFTGGRIGAIRRGAGSDDCGASSFLERRASKRDDSKFRSLNYRSVEPEFVLAEDRIATFDQDGTLWVEHPVYTQAMFALDRVHVSAQKVWNNSVLGPRRSGESVYVAVIAVIPVVDFIEFARAIENGSQKRLLTTGPGGARHPDRSGRDRRLEFPERAADRPLEMNVLVVGPAKGEVCRC
jgi:hypothetical protein